MLNSKQRALLRSLAATEDTIIQVGKGGITDSVTKQVSEALAARELVKGRVLESAMMTAREVSDARCEETGAEGVSTVGATFVIWKKSEKLEQKAKAAATAAAKAKKKVNPVKVGRQRRRAQAKAEKEKRAQYFHDEAVKAAIERRKQFYQE